MMKRMKQYWGLLVLASAVALVFLLSARITSERSEQTVALYMPVEEIALMSEASGEDEATWLERFHEWGLTAVAIEEESLSSLVEKEKGIAYDLVGNFAADPFWRQGLSEKQVALIESDAVDADDLVFFSTNEPLNERLIEGIQARYDDASYELIDDGLLMGLLRAKASDRYYNDDYWYKDDSGKGIKLPVNYVGSRVEDAGLFYDKNQIEAVKASGLGVMLRPKNHGGQSEQAVAAFEKSLDQYAPDQQVVVFSGAEALGYPEGLDEMRALMKERGLSVALIEATNGDPFIKQKGITDLVTTTDYQAIRLFPMSPYIQERFAVYGYEGAEEIENTLYRAITERSMRSVYFRPFMKSRLEPVTDPTYYAAFFENLSNRLAPHGYTLGEAQSTEANGSHLVFETLAALGLLGIGLFWLARQPYLPLPDWALIGLTVIGTLGVVGIYRVAPYFSATLFGFVATVLFPIIIADHLVAALRTRYLAKGETTPAFELKEALFALALYGSVAIIGGLFVSALMGHSRFLLKLDYSRGVKIAQLLPLAAVVAFYVLRFGLFKKREEMGASEVHWHDLLEVLRMRVQIWHGVLAVALAAVGYIYLSRTGNDAGLGPTVLERMVRTFLERTFPARPRTKEFLIAWPTLFVMYFFLFRRVKVFTPLLLLGAMLGITSVLNTFNHLWTPVYISVVRTVAGLGIGAVIGLLAGGVLLLGYRFLWRRREHG